MPCNTYIHTDNHAHSHTDRQTNKKQNTARHTDTGPMAMANREKQTDSTQTDIQTESSRPTERYTARQRRRHPAIPTYKQRQTQITHYQSHRLADRDPQNAHIMARNTGRQSQQTARRRAGQTDRRTDI